MTSPRALRSLLFAPANREAVFDKAVLSGADAVCLDLEDAVPPDQKARARGPALSWLARAEPGLPWRGVRINGMRTPQGLSDLAAVCSARPETGFILLPKVDAAADVQIAAEVLQASGSCALLGALIESAAGLEAVSEIARASDRLGFVMFGGVDLSAELGCDGSDAALAYARGRVVHAARMAGRPALDVPALEFRDLDSVAGAATRARAHGFSGKAAIHPSNIAPINTAFSPTAEEIAEAEEIVALFEAAPTGLVVRHGKLIERPVIRTMQARLALARSVAQS